MFNITETAKIYVNKRFTKASILEKEKIVNDWKNKEVNSLALVADFKKRVGEVFNKKILDAGCGNGGLSIAFAREGAIVSGVDIEKELYDIAKKYADSKKVSVDFVLYDGYKMPFSENEFDYAASASVLEHTDDPAFYLNEIMRVLKPGGVLYLGFPNKFAFRETHTQILFLTYLPSFLRQYYIKLLKRNPLEENNLHFYSYFDLEKMIKNNKKDKFYFKIIEEKGESKNFIKILIKKFLGIFGLPYKAFLPHIILLLKKEINE